MRFDLGEVVQLRSGGPMMTVIGFSEHSDWVICQWFWNNKMESGSFPPQSLQNERGED